MSPQQKYPPKRKHQNKPRQTPLPPLSETEKRVRAYQEMQKALVHLGEAEKLAAWGGAPTACVHVAYYAMHHAARAALFANGGVGKLGDVPLSHEHVIEHYGKLVAGRDGILGETGRMLSRARTDRTIGDYDLVRSISTQDAKLTAKDARSFVDECQGTWSFDSPHSGDDP